MFLTKTFQNWTDVSRITYKWSISGLSQMIFDKSKITDDKKSKIHTHTHTIRLLESYYLIKYRLLEPLKIALIKRL